MGGTCPAEGPIGTGNREPGTWNVGGRRPAARAAVLTVALGLAFGACGGDGPEGTASPSPSPSERAAVLVTPPVTPTPTPARTVSIIGGGDVMLGRSLADGINANGPLWPF